MALPDGTTLADLVRDRTLDDPDDFVARAFLNLHEVRKEHGDVVLCIGRAGNGRRPNYRVDVTEKRCLFGDETTRLLVVACFRGDNHKPYTPEGEEADILKDAGWSTGMMTYDEVRALIGQIRGLRPTHA